MSKSSIGVLVVVALWLTIGCAKPSPSDNSAKSPDPLPMVDAGEDVMYLEKLFTVDHYDPERDATQDLDTTIAMASESGKRILVEVGGQW